MGRPDFTECLIHLTRERIGTKRHFETTSKNHDDKKEFTAIAVLKEILRDGVIKGSNHSGYIKGLNTAVCFSEIPLSGLRYFAKIEGHKAKYRFYGIAISKEAAFKCGGRPVIYLPDAEGGWIPEEEKWRHVRFEYGQVDFTFEREWRIKGDLELKRLPGFYVIIRNPAEMKELEKVIHPECKELVRGYLPMQHLLKMF